MFVVGVELEVEDTTMEELELLVAGTVDGELLVEELDTTAKL